jgi:hypothetical protein
MHETMKSKLKYEKFCRDHGVVPQEKFHTDRGSAFTSEELHQHLQAFHQGITYAGTGAHHHNVIAERAIQTVMSCARNNVATCRHPLARSIRHSAMATGILPRWSSVQ